MVLTVTALRIPRFRLALFAATAFAAWTAIQAEEIEAVSGRVSPDYIRAKLPDGSFRPETYAFGKGGFWSGPMVDLTIDKMEFTEVAGTIAPPLANQNYFASKDPATTKLLIMG